MKVVSMPIAIRKYFEPIFLERPSRRLHKKAHVSEVVFCFRKGWYNRFFGNKVTLDNYCKMGRGEAVEAWYLQHIPKEAKQVKCETEWLVGHVDAVLDDGTWKFGIEMKTTVWGKDANTQGISEYYMQQAMMYSYMLKMPIVIWIHNFVLHYAGEKKARTDEQQFIIVGDEDDKKLYSPEWFKQRNAMGKRFMEHVINRTLPPRVAFYDWECGYCAHADQCGKDGDGQICDVLEALLKKENAEISFTAQE